MALQVPELIVLGYLVVDAINGSAYRTISDDSW